MKNTTDIQLAYLAGILDGEGYISIHRLKKAKDKEYKSYVPIVTIQMTDFQPVRLFKRIFGGFYAEYPKQLKSGKVVYVWSVHTHKNVQIVLTALLPYLQIKKKEAKFALIFIRHMLKITGSRPRPGRGHAYPTKVREYQEASFYKMKALKHRKV